MSAVLVSKKLGVMRKLAAVLVFLALYLAYGHAFGLSFDLRGPTFKAGHPQRGEQLQAAVTTGEMEALAETVGILNRYPEILFEVSGHADQGECTDYDCHDLALRRAVLVYRYLIDAGVSPKRVVSLTEYSSTRPIASGQEGREVNSRAEINVALEP